MAGQLSELEKLLKSIDDDLVGFAAGLAAKGYRNEKRLRAASKEGLLSVDGMLQGDADLIVSHFKNGTVSASDAKLDRVVELLEAREVKRFRFSEGNSGKSEAVVAAMVQLGLVSTHEGTLPARWPRGYNSYDFTPYQWPEVVDEEKESLKLQKHLEGELAKLGVPFGRGGYQVQDVRGQDKLSFECTSATATLAFNGGTDAVVTAFSEGSWELQSFALIDWKTPISLTAYNSKDAQQKLELMGALHHSNRPAIVIFTDLVNFIIHQPYGKAIRFFHTFETPDAGRISTTEAMKLIAYHVTVLSPKELAFHFQQLESIPENSELGQLASALLAAKKLSGAGEGLAEQLSIIKDLPSDEQLEAASETILAWRHQLS